MIRTVAATRYVTPLREGGSLPAIVEADDDGTYVLKFRGAGQGPRALIAELIAGEIGRALGLPVPELVLMTLDPVLARSEPHEEIRDLITASAGLNLGMDYLPGSFGFDPVVASPDRRKTASPFLPVPPLSPELAAAIVWFDAYVTNVDRTPRNPNMLIWHKELWLIDHGASLYFHHDWHDYLARSRAPFPRIKDHVLLPIAGDIAAADAALAPRLTPTILEAIVAAVPADWLGDTPEFAGVDEHRAAYLAYLLSRLAAPRAFVEEAIRARAEHL